MKELRHRMSLKPFVPFTERKPLEKVYHENGFLISNRPILTMKDSPQGGRPSHFEEDHLNAFIHDDSQQSVDELRPVYNCSTTAFHGHVPLCWFVIAWLACFRTELPLISKNSALTSTSKAKKNNVVRTEKQLPQPKL